jgi:DNA-binding Lrp family transcriptional regulator
MTFVRVQQRERDLLGRVSLAADRSLRELAQISGHQVHTVRYTLERLQARNLLQRAWVIDVFKLGWLRVQLLVSLGRSSRDKVIDYFMKAPRITHVSEVGGPYDLDILILSRDVTSVLTLLSEASEACGCLFSSKAVVVQSSIAYFPRKYLCKGEPSYGAIVCGDRPGVFPLTEIDQGVLEMLTAEPSIEKKEMARRLKVSVPTLDLRLKKMRSEGVIRGAMFSARYSGLGAQNYKVLISSRKCSSTVRQEIYQFAYKHPHCTSYRDGLGAWDYEISAECEEQRQILTLKDELWRQFGKYLATLEVIPRLSMLLFSSYPLKGAAAFASCR